MPESAARRPRPCSHLLLRDYLTQEFGESNSTQGWLSLIYFTLIYTGQRVKMYKFFFNSDGALPNLLKRCVQILEITLSLFENFNLYLERNTTL